MWTFLKIVILALFIFVSVILGVDIATIIFTFVHAYKNKQNYQKTLWGELVLLLMWSLLLASLIVIR